MELLTDDLLLCNEDSALESPSSKGDSSSSSPRNAELLEEALPRCPPEAPPQHYPPLDKGLLQSMLRRELDHMPMASYIPAMQKHVMTAGTRTQLVDWILKIQMYHGLHPHTAALAVNYFDRFLSKYRLPEEPWGPQLVAVTCLSLAAKMEEVAPPTILELQVGAEDFFDYKAVHRFEVVVLSTLLWRMGAVIPYSYLAHCIQALQVPVKLSETIMGDCIEVLLHSLRDMRMQEFRPSMIAAAIVWCVLANAELGDDKWDWEGLLAELSESFSCPLCDLKKCYLVLDDVVFGPMESPVRIPVDDVAEETTGKQHTMSPTSVLESPGHSHKRERSCEPQMSPEQTKRGRYDDRDTL